MATGKNRTRQQWEDWLKQQPRGVDLGPPVVKPKRTNVAIVNDALLKLGAGAIPAVAPTASQIDTTKRGRHGERTTIVDGIKFRSKLEADRYRELKLLRAAGQVKWFLRQVPFDVSLGVVYRLDFLVCWNRSGIADEALTYEETKGHLTDASRIKIGVVQERYAIKINILRRADVSRG